MFCAIFDTETTNAANMTDSMGNCNSCFAMFSLFSSAAACAGFFLPYWIKGQLKHPTTVATFFGTFRRCTFPQITPDQTEIIIINECGRYSTFLDIPSVSWQLTTLVVGIGSGLTLFSAVLAFFACWINNMWTGIFVKALGWMHLTAGLLITIGLCIYPLGWDHREVRDACGQSDKYKLGSCRIYWCYFVLIAAATTEFFLWVMSLGMSRRTNPTVIAGNASAGNSRCNSLRAKDHNYVHYDYAQEV